MILTTPGIALLLTSLAGVTDWPHWRGPHFNGSTEAQGLPVEWSATDGVAWRTDLPGQSAATPIVVAGRVFLTALVPEGEVLLALCLDRATGEVLWEREAGKGRTPSPRSWGRENTLAACSAVSDGELVCFLFGSGDLMACDLEGELLWKRNLAQEYGELVVLWGYASSPLLYEGTLYVQVLHRAESYLLGIDPRTGENRWRYVRPNQAKAESQEAYTTPMPFDNKGRQEILVLGADCLTSHDPATGQEYWRWCGLNPRDQGNMRAVSNTVVGEDGFVFVTSPQHNPMHGLRVDGDRVEEVWSFDRPTPDACTPLYYRDRLYALDGHNQRMVCLMPETGELVWQAELDTPTFLRTSPTGADGKIYVMDAEGCVLVLAAADEFQLLGRVELGSYPSRSSIVVDDGQLLIRTAEHLYCIGRAEESR